MSKKEIVNDYISECTPLLDAIVENVFVLSVVDEQAFSDSIDLIFRAFHTIKSNSSIIEEDGLVELCHICEDALFEIRDNSKKINPDLIAALMMAIEFLNDSFIRLDSDVEMEAVDSGILFKLASFIES